MKHIRPFHPEKLGVGQSQELLPEAEGADCVIRLRRGPGDAADGSIPLGSERFVLVLSGSAELSTGETAARGDLIFIPAGAEANVIGSDETTWIEVDAPTRNGSATASTGPKVVRVDPARFEGNGFAYQTLISANDGATTMRMNVMKVEPGAGSPDYHIHQFAQMYVILEGAMTIDIGRKRAVAGENSLVVLPAGVVHRNFNSSEAIERHVSFLVPEPVQGDVFDFAVTIHDAEAELLTQIPA